MGRWCLLLVALALLATGCSERAAEQPKAPAPSSSHIDVTLPPPEPGIHLTLIQQRLDEGTDRVGLRVENNSAETLVVRQVGLAWAGYGTFMGPADTTVEPGATLDLPMRLPPERCHADVSAAPVGIAVTRTRTIRDEVDDMGVRFAERLWRTGCAARRIQAAAAFTYGAPWRRVGTDRSPVLVTSLRIARRRGSEAITLVETQGTVLFDLRPTGGTTLPPDQRVGNLPLRITPGRCDEHARSQASQPFTFRVLLQLGDEPVVLPLVLLPDRAQRRSLLQFLDEACASR